MLIRKLQAAITHTLFAEQERWLLWLPVAMGCGVLFYFGLAAEPRPLSGIAALTLTLPALWRWRRYPFLRAFLLACFGVALGFAAAQFQAQRVATPVLERPIRFTTLQGHLAHIQDTEGGMKLVIEDPVIVASLRGGTADEATQKNKAGLPRYARNDDRKLPHRIRLNLRKSDPALKAGQQIRLRAGLFPLPLPALPGGFDMARHFYFQGIGAVGFGIAPVEVLKEPELLDAEEWLNAVRHQFSRSIRAAIPSVEGTIADALITGEQSAIPEALREEMAVAGIAHMLSISGLHLSLVAGIFFVVIRFALVLIPGFALRYPLKKWAAGAALLGSFAYLALAGFPVAANRSFVMVALVLGAVLLDRQVLSLRSVALAAIVLLLWKPESLLGPSFQLSFAATVAIVALYEVYQRKPLSAQFHDWWLVRPWFYLCGIALTSLVAGLATTPYVILHFHQFTLYHILANLLTSPILSLLVMPAGLLAVCLMPLGLAAPVFVVMGWGITQIIALAQWVAGLPLAVSYAPAFPDWGIACFTLGALWLCCWRQRWRLAGVPLMVVGMASLWFSTVPEILIAPDGMQVAMRTEKGGYAMLKGSNRNFIAQIWKESLGIEAFDTPAAMQCDALGCVVTHNNEVIALPFTHEAAQEDCRIADILIADFYRGTSNRPRGGAKRGGAERQRGYRGRAPTNKDVCSRKNRHFYRPDTAIALSSEGEVERAQSYISRVIASRLP